nr:zinc finger BED domain-containing protein 1-like [Onthophagus taurus]
MSVDAITCYAHNLQLVLNKVLDADYIKPLIVKCSSIVSHFKHSYIASTALNTKQEQLGLQKHKLIQAVRTRWNSTYYMLKRLVEQREAILSVLSDRTITSRIQAGHLMLEEEEWITMEYCIAMLEPFELVTTLLSSESQPTISIVMPILKSLAENFISKTKEDEPKLLQNLQRLLQNEFQSRFENILSNVSVTAGGKIGIFDLSTFLDPRFKNKERFTGSLFQTKRHFKNILQSSLEDTENEMNHNPKKKSAFDILFPNENSAAADLNEVDMYYSDCPIQKNMCPLQWWKNNENKYPKLSKYAKRYLSIPATSVSSERSFSKAGNVVNAKRACLKSDNVKKICFLSASL